MRLTTYQPGTNRVDIYRCSDFQLGQFYLVDTPGFDDTHRTDTEILLEVTTWLSRLRQESILLTGIIYLHRIFDNRVGGSGMRNLRSFKRLCGDKYMSQVVLATTMWNMTDEPDALKRERELMEKSEFWGSMIANGSKVFRQDKDKESARAIIKYLIDKKASNRAAPRPLAIQVEMVDQGMALDMTGAGQEMQSELVKQKAEYEAQLKRLQEKLERALREKDRDWQAQLEQYQRDARAKAEQAEKDRQKLHASNAVLMKRLEAQEENRYDEWRRERDERARLTAQLEFELRMMNERNVSEDEKRKLRDQLQEEHNKHEMLKWKIRQSQARCVLM